MTGLPVKGILNSISFCVNAGDPFNITVTGTPGTTASFTSSNSTIIPPPSSSVIPDSGVLIVSTVTASVTQAAIVTIAVAASPVPPTIPSDQPDVKGTALSLSIYVQPTSPA